MKKKFYNYIVFCFIAVAICICMCFSFKPNSYVNASTPVVGGLNMLALGDASAVGYGIQEDTYTIGSSSFTNDTYNYLLNEYLGTNQNYGSTNAVNCLTQDITSSGLVDLLNNSDIIEKVSKANIITISIGYNDIFNSIYTNDFVQSDIVNICSSFSTNLYRVFTKINEINPNSYIFVNNIYNPYVSYKFLPEDFGFTLESKVVKKSDIITWYNFFQDYICGKGANNLTFNDVINQVSGSFANVNVVDVYAGLTAKQNDYTSYVVCDLSSLKDQETSITDYNSLNEYYLTKDGHELVYEEIVKLFSQNFCNVSFDAQGGYFNDITNINKIKYLIKKGEKLNSELLVPKYSASSGQPDKIFDYWIINKTTNELFDINQPIQNNMTVYAVWANMHLVTFYDNLKDPHTEGVKENTKLDECQVLKNYVGTKAVYGYFKDDEFNQEYSKQDQITSNIDIYIKYIEMAQPDAEYNNQIFSPNTKSIPFFVNARQGQTIDWYVNDEKFEHEPYDTTVVEAVDGEQVNGYTWEYFPTSAGQFTISCKIEGGIVEGKTINLNYSVPTEADLKIYIQKIFSNKRTMTLSIDQNIAKYLNPSCFTWYRTVDAFHDEFSEQIGTGVTSLTYNFPNDCKVKVVYNSGGTQSAKLSSDAIEVKLFNYVDNEMVILISVISGVVVILVLVAVFATIRYKRRMQEDQ